MKKILANDGIDAAGKKLLEQAGFEVFTNNIPQAELAEYIHQNHIEILTVRSATKVRKELIDACSNLKIIGRGGVGMDNIDVEYARNKGIKVINTPAASSHSVAELVMAHMFSMARFLAQSNRLMPQNKEGQFSELKKEFSKGIELKNKTLGIIGFGRIGQALAKIALGCGMNVIASDPFVKDAELELEIYGLHPFPKVCIQTIDMKELIAQSDFISLHIPGGEILGATEIGLMKKGAMLINASRGGVINENALIEALDSGQIAMAALDVFNNEPTPDSRLLNHPKISETPHTGASTLEAQERVGIELANLIITAYSEIQPSIS
jgi:D-3-phosphoglycerate dehydrogenase / 2-oxoglutarate reductase